jgi:hypothetical protein
MFVCAFINQKLNHLKLMLTAAPLRLIPLVPMKHDLPIFVMTSITIT